MPVPDIHPPLAGEIAVLAELEFSQHAMDIAARDFVVESLKTCEETMHRCTLFWMAPGGGSTSGERLHVRPA